MFLQQIYRGLRFTAILTSLELAAIAQLPIDGIADKGFYNNSVTYRVQACR